MAQSATLPDRLTIPKMAMPSWESQNLSGFDLAVAKGITVVFIAIHVIPIPKSVATLLGIEKQT
ncbi:hypothetical protein [Pseudanabaena sp. 'Roaring Creek']|uniref:hypothetical protein n=1 Tax=Pseudanabaena sp. 'Roaring Creek' TaxID=1681830 RepID=UPI0006D862B0|nr:hypothetical protein [Pseudanabaena sp. 'Roaring Creek']